MHKLSPNENTDLLCKFDMTEKRFETHMEFLVNTLHYGFGLQIFLCRAIIRGFDHGTVRIAETHTPVKRLNITGSSE